MVYLLWYVLTNTQQPTEQVIDCFNDENVTFYNDKEVTKYIEIILKATKKPEKIKQSIPEEQQLNFPDLDFDNNQNQIELNPNAEMQLIKQCGFISLGDAIKRIIYFIEVMEKECGSLYVKKNHITVLFCSRNVPSANLRFAHSLRGHQG